MNTLSISSTIYIPISGSTTTSSKNPNNEPPKSSNKTSHVAELSQKTTALMRDLLRAGLSVSTAEELRRGAVAHWNGYYREHTKDLLQQTHSIKGLKIYRDVQTGGITATYRIKTLQEGTHKKVLLTYDFKNGLSVRYTSLDKSPAQKQLFLNSMTRELEVRHCLPALSDTIIPITVHTYINQRGEIKKRYQSPLCTEDLFSYVFEHESTARTINCLQKPTKNFLEQALEALAQMHHNHWAHLDAKPENFFLINDKILIADCEGSAPIGGRRSIGTHPYRAPEVYKTEYAADSKADIFSFGITLLAISDTETFLSLEKTPPQPNAFCTCLQEIQKRYQQSNLPLQLFIAKLIDLNPSQRPTGDEALQQFRILAPIGTQ